MYYTYILKCEDGTYYTGITTDVFRRFFEHKSGSRLSAKYTKRHKPLSIEAVWSSNGRSEASKLECFIKKLSHSEKEELVTNPSLSETKYADDISKDTYKYHMEYKTKKTDTNQPL
ncbi:MAG: GIY-YIG nuclease family protein [Clostridia bacterium]|nr:GIY-YIG nuclease family protein [Clostridia bacterium]